MKRFLAGLGLGSLAAAVTYAVTQVPPWWWAIGLTVAVIVWFAEWVLDGVTD